MALITSLSTLKGEVSTHLNRGGSDLSASGGPIEVAIQTAEARFRRDPRVREPGSNNTVLPSLFTTDPNWLLTAQPDVYLYGALVELQPFLRDDERLAVYEERLQDAIDSLSGSVRLDPARTLALTTYAELQTTVADMLERGDLKTIVPVLIVGLERDLARDPRVRHTATADYSITGDNLAVPTGFKSLEELYFDDGTNFGSIKNVPASKLAEYKRRYGTTGRPRAVSVLGETTLRFGPAPDQTYAAKIVYVQTVTALASGLNWLYTAHPDIYLWGAAAQAGPWVRRDQRALATVEEAKQQLEDRLERLSLSAWHAQWGGDLTRQIDPIG